MIYIIIGFFVIGFLLYKNRKPNPNPELEEKIRQKLEEIGIR